MKDTIQATLYKELDKLVKGEVGVKHAKAVTQMSAQIIYCDRLKLETIRANTDIKRLAKTAKQPKAIK